MPSNTIESYTRLMAYRPLESQRRQVLLRISMFDNDNSPEIWVRKIPAVWLLPFSREKSQLLPSIFKSEICTLLQYYKDTIAQQSGSQSCCKYSFR